MGTRADFYSGRGKDAEWLGSIALDGYPEGNPEDFGILVVESDDAFRGCVKAMEEGLDHFTRPDQGWPWPWDNSHTTDYAYAFDDGKVWISCFGCAWVDSARKLEEVDGKAAEVPDMSDRKNVTLGGRSGLIVIGPGGPES